MKIDCLMGTYARHALACEALACFLQQSELSNATLLVYNQHPVPLRVDHPKVRVVNEAPPPGSLRYIKKRMLEFADPAADLIHWWDDDDLYLPWHLKDCLDHIGTNVAWKPASSWVSLANVTYSREANMFEGSWVFRSDYLKAARLDTHLDYIEHPVFLQTLRCRKACHDRSGRADVLYLSLGNRGGASERIWRFRKRGSPTAPRRTLEGAQQRCVCRRQIGPGRHDRAVAAISRRNQRAGHSGRVGAQSQGSGPSLTRGSEDV